MLTEVDQDMFSMFGRTEAQQKGNPRGQRMSDSRATTF